MFTTVQQNNQKVHTPCICLPDPWMSHWYGHQCDGGVQETVILKTLYKHFITNLYTNRMRKTTCGMCLKIFCNKSTASANWRLIQYEEMKEQEKNTCFFVWKKQLHFHFMCTWTSYSVDREHVKSVVMIVIVTSIKHITNSVSTFLVGFFIIAWLLTTLTINTPDVYGAMNKNTKHII